MFLPSAGSADCGAPPQPLALACRTTTLLADHGRPVQSFERTACTLDHSFALQASSSARVDRAGSHFPPACSISSRQVAAPLRRGTAIVIAAQRNFDRGPPCKTGQADRTDAVHCSNTKINTAMLPVCTKSTPSVRNGRVETFSSTEVAIGSLA